MLERETVESPAVKREILFKIDKLKMPTAKTLTPLLYAPNIFTFVVNEVCEEKIQKVDVNCDEAEKKINGTYIINNQYISCNVYYSASLMNVNC